MDDLNRKRHAVYKLTYHAVFVIKYRRKVMTEPIITHMRQYATHLIEQCYQGKCTLCRSSIIFCTWNCCCRVYKTEISEYAAVSLETDRCIV